MRLTSARRIRPSSPSIRCARGASAGGPAPSVSDRGDVTTEHEAAVSRLSHTRMEVPTDLVPAVREIIARYERAHKPH